jgi:hypothetical protein
MEIEDNKKYASNSKGNAALTTGIIGTALGGLLALGGGGGLFGGGGVTAIAEKENADYVDVTKQYYQGQISNIREIQSMYEQLNNKIVDSSFALYKNQRDEKDALLARISALETKQAVDAAIEPWRAKVIEMQIGGVAAQSAAALAMEAERRQCADNAIVSYANNTFYPVSVANVTVSTTAATAKTTFNPLAGLTTPILPPPPVV